MVDFNQLNLLFGMIAGIGISFTKIIGKYIFYLLYKCMYAKRKQICAMFTDRF